MAFGFGWLKPTKSKLVLFLIILAILYYMPVVPTLSSPVIMTPTYSWTFTSPAYSVQSIGIMGVNNQYFGVFTGTEAALINALYILTIAYVFACVLVYMIHRPRPRKEGEHQHRELPDIGHR
jgi:preprotein translocase subunit SecG